MWEKLRPSLEKYYNQYDASHDMAHIERVYENAKRILAAYPEANEEIVTFAVALHDVEDKKYANEQSADFMKFIFTTYDVSLDQQKQIRTIIDQVSFSGGQTAESLEAQIVQDADRLDALGAVGIARTFAFGGANGRSLYQSSEVEALWQGKEVPNGASITHFYEKLLLLKDKMNTEEAKNLAQQRHEFMLLFLQQLYDEIGEQPCRN
ncbi:HD domain-containing protein [Chryseomicrobium sp. FSL W7-1435]|uniref:HD domain-containing protein n=1 Tax=Chryseomicrobium sp. FSL W7-1435 TaxID=2921704 RepID=UPI003159B41B